MTDYNTKNYTEQGGDITIIGGKLVITEGARIEGLPIAANQANSTTTQVLALRSEFNELLVKLKEAGLMMPDTWAVTAVLAPSPTDAVVAANNAKVGAVLLNEGKITVKVDVDTLEESESSAPGQGTHKWLCLCIGTGHADLTDVKYNGTQLTTQDAEEATSCGCDAGCFVLYIKAELVATESKTFTLKADGYAEVELTVEVVPLD